MTKPRQAARHERIEYQSLDGNWVLFPIGYCTWHKRYITEKQAKIHRCHAKHGGVCGRYQNMKGEYVRKMKVEQYYDKQIDKLTRIETALNKLVKTFENISNFCDMMVEMYREESISKAEKCKSNDMIDDGR